MDDVPINLSAHDCTRELFSITFYVLPTTPTLAWFYRPRFVRCAMRVYWIRDVEEEAGKRYVAIVITGIFLSAFLFSISAFVLCQQAFLAYSFLFSWYCRGSFIKRQNSRDIVFQKARHT